MCAALPLFVVLATSAAPTERIVAIGDIHGDFPDFVAILRQTGLIDDNRQWIGGRTVLVQTGDVVDRGPQTRECLDLLMELERQTKKKNGEVITNPSKEHYGPQA
ncbi:MAG TPA: metallophosphoesterase [Terriglobia bacterium]|nr:metallophosphoesterase [Terriglobia bacterium]